jgi:hypothetical protein
VIVIHDAPCSAVHAQPLAVVTAIDVPVPAVAGTDWLVGLIDAAQEPGLRDGVGLTGDRKRPGPRAARVGRDRKRHRAIAVAARARCDREPRIRARCVHAHPAAIVTATELLPAVAAIDALAGANVARHDPVCVTVSV